MHLCGLIDELHVLLLQSAAGVGTRSSLIVFVGVWVCLLGDVLLSGSLRKITPIQHDQLSSGQRLTCSKIQVW